MLIPRFGMQFNNQVPSNSRYHERVSQLDVPDRDDGLELLLIESSKDGKKGLDAIIRDAEESIVHSRSDFQPGLFKSVKGFLQDLSRVMEGYSVREAKTRRFLNEQQDTVEGLFEQVKGWHPDLEDPAEETSENVRGALDNIQAIFAQFHLESGWQNSLRMPGFAYGVVPIEFPGGTRASSRTVLQEKNGINIAQATAGQNESRISQGQIGIEGGRYLAFESNGANNIHQGADHSNFVVMGAAGTSKVNQRGHHSRFLYVADQNGEADIQQSGDHSTFIVQGRNGTHTKLALSTESQFFFVGGAVELYGSIKDWKYDLSKQCYTHQATQTRVFASRDTEVTFAKHSNPITEGLKSHHRRNA